MNARRTVLWMLALSLTTTTVLACLAGCVAPARGQVLIDFDDGPTRVAITTRARSW